MDHKELKAAWKDEVEVKAFSLQDVAKHKTNQDIWIVIHGKVYNVTKYLIDHPGGADALLEVGGVDATSAYEDVGHSDDAGEIMHGFLIGVLDTPAAPATSRKSSSTTATTQVVRRKADAKEKSTTESHINFSQAGLAVLAVGGAAGLGLVGRSLESGGFLTGFLTATVGLTAAGGLGLQWLSTKSNFGAGDFQKYPAHMRSTVSKISSFHPSGVLTPSDYQDYPLLRRKEVSDGIYLFTFSLPDKYSVLGLPVGQHIAIRASLSGTTVVRSYTPISNNRDLGRLELIIRVYPDGQVGNYLKNLAIGDKVQIRGPKGAMKYRKGMAKSIGMIGGGTGITPLFQIIRSVCEDPSDNTQISLIYGNRSESDIMLKEKLDRFAKVAGHKFKLFYILDNPGPGWTGGKGHVTTDLLKEKMPPASPDSKMMLCGPPGMVNAMKKNLVALGFDAPGAVRKASDQIFCF